MISAFVLAVFFAWILFGESMADRLGRFYRARLAHRERMAVIAAKQERARALAAATPQRANRDDVPPELIEAWREVNELTHD